MIGTESSSLSLLRGSVRHTVLLVGAVLWSFLLPQGVAAEPTEGSVLSKKWEVSPLPLLFYTTDTGIAGGLTLVGAPKHGDGTDDRSSFVRLSATYTQMHQGEFTAGITGPLVGDDYLGEGEFSYFNYPATFYGLGAEAELSERYESQQLEASAAVLRTVGTHAYVGPRLALGHQRFSEVATDSKLATFLGQGVDSETFAGAGIVARYDSRNSPHFPTSGYFGEAQMTLHAVTRETAGMYAQFELDGRTFVSIGRSLVLATRGFAASSLGEVPLAGMTELGGLFLLRGYPAGRYAGEHVITGQAELRVPLFWRLRLVSFLAAGAVSREIDTIFASSPKVSGGVGLRLSVNQARDINIRVDLGFSPDGTGVYITLLEAF